MSAIQFIVKSIQDMGEADRQAVFAAFGFGEPAKAAKVPKVPKVPKAAKAPKAPKEPKKPRANAGIGNAWTAFCSKIQQDNKAEVDAVKAAAAVKRAEAKQAGLSVPPETQGAHLHWCKSYRDAHEAEWKAFEAAWKEAHPKGAATVTTAENSDDAATVVDDETGAAIGGGGSVAAPVAKPMGEPVPKKRGPKKMADMTPEEQAAAKAKRAANKAAKASATNSAEGSRASSPPKMKGE